MFSTWRGCLGEGVLSEHGLFRVTSQSIWRWLLRLKMKDPVAKMPMAFCMVSLEPVLSFFADAYRRGNDCHWEQS